MTKYILKRVGYAVITVFFLTAFTFFMMQLLPGKPFVGDKAISEATMAALNAKYGLDKPVAEQFLIYVGNAVQGDLGMSTKYTRPVTSIIGESFPYSCELGLRALIIATVFGVALGTIAAIKHGTAWDTSAMVLAIVGVSVPSFIIGALLQYVFSVLLFQATGVPIFPVGGWKTEAAKILPSIALSFGSMATIARLMRTSMLDVLGSDYIKTARAKGLSNTKIVWRHAIRNAIMPVITVLGPTAAALMTGAFVIENIFNIPGMGKFFVLAIKESDYTLVAGTTLFYGAFLVVAVLVVDILYGIIDPRVNLAKVKE